MRVETAVLIANSHDCLKVWTADVKESRMKKKGRERHKEK
jgi:hypothetical protein